MTRDITITFADGSTHTYKNAPDTITPETVQKRAQAQFGKSVASIDGGRESPSVGADDTPPEDSKGYLTKIREGAESIIEPVATLASGLVAAPVAGFAGMAGDAYSGLTGGPRIGKQVAADVMQGMTYAPRSEGARENLASLGKMLDKSKLAGLPVVGQEIPMMMQGTKLGVQLVKPLVESKIQSIGTSTQRLASDVMINALKGTPTQLLKGDVQVAAEELLKRGLSPNEKGVAALEARIAELNSEIANKIGSSTALINKQKVLQRLEEVRDRFAKTVNPESDLAAIQSAGSEFSRHPLAPSENIPIQLAQEMKKATGLELRKKYGELGSAQTESQKAIVRGLKEEIATAEPAVAALNAEERALFRTLNVAERRSFMEMNKDPIPLYGALRSPSAWAAFTADKSTAFKALLARWINKLGKKLSGPVMEKANRKAEIGFDDSPLPQSPQQPMPQGRGLLSLADSDVNPGPILKSGERPATPNAIPFSDPNAIPFPLRQEVLQRPEIVKATEAFAKEANRLQNIIDNSQGFWRTRAIKELNALQEKFDAGMRQLGIETRGDANGLQRRLYQGGQGNQLQIQKTRGMMTGANQ